jgi:hypothetical protein
MQTSMSEGKGGVGKPVPEMQRIPVHHLLRGADQGKLRPASCHTWRSMPCPTSVPVTVEIFYDSLVARRAAFDWPVGAAGG